MYPVKNPARDARNGNFSSTRWAAIKLLLVSLLTASVPLALYVRVDSKAEKAVVTAQAQAAGQGGSSLNLQSRQELRVDYRGDQNVIQAMQSGQAKARTMASADIDGNGTPDLVAGYTYGGIGIVTIQRGNPEAFAPKDESVYLRMHQGYNPDSLVPTAQTYQVPEPADFLQAGDFNNDSFADVLVGAQGRDLFLLAGNGQGNLAEPIQITLPGVVTAVAAGQFRAPDGRIDLAVGIDGPSGPQVLIYDGAEGVTGEPMRLALASPATALEFGEMDDSPFMGLAIATGSEINVLHGWGRKQSPQLESRVERIDTGMNVRGLASGFFMWSREGSKQLAALGDDGTIRIFGRGKLNTQPLSDQEMTARARLRLQAKDTTKIDVETLSGWQSAKADSWSKARELVTGNFVGANATRNLLRSTHISFTGTDDLMVLGGSSKVDIVRQIDTRTSAPANAKLIGSDFAVTSLESADAPATLALPQKLNGWRDLLVMEAGSVSPTVVPLAPTAIITVDRTDDPNGAALAAASVCGAGASDCSLRGAVQFANQPANAGSTINLGTNTYTLNTNGNGGCVRESLATGNTIGDLEVNQTTTFTGTGQGLTIINQIGTGTGPTFTGDRVLCMDVNLTAGLTFTFSGMTVAGGRDVASGIGGGGFIGGAKNTTLNLTNVTFANNQTSPGVPQGPVGGGAVSVTGGNMNVTSCTFGAANNPGASRTDLTLGNAATTVSGGGLSYSAGDPAGSLSATGTLTITGTTFTHNTSSSTSGGGGGLDVLEFNTSVGTGNISTSAFTSNQATGTASGGGIIQKSMTTLNISTTSFTSNSAGNRGGGLQVGGGTTNLNGTVASITFSGNTATTAGSSISAASFVNLSGTNTTIGGDLEITTNGVWTNQVGSTMSPTNFIMTGTASFTGNNSTTNVGGNFNFGSGTFSAGTSLFNFNGTTAQSITNSSAITFFNLTDSNITQPLTLNNNFAVSNILNINGANAILAPVAAAVISGGTGTLTGTGTARVTRTGADSFFTQYTMPTRTLTNLTVEYIGAAAQTASATTYFPLKITNASGVNLGGATTVNGQLTLQTGALGVGTQTLVINNGTTVVGGSLTSGATGTVNYNQGSAGQSVIAANYGNLTFSAFTKVLASTGTIGVAGTFNPNGVTTGHTITGSTFDFNATGAQTVPVFNYNNLTISGARGGLTVTLASGSIGVAGTFNPSATGVVYSFIGNTIDFNGSGAQTVPVFNYNNLTISGNRGGAAITLASGNIGIAGVFNPSVTNNSFVTTGNTVVLNGAVLQTIPAFTFNGLTLNNAAGANLGANVAVDGALTLTSGNLGVGTNTLTLNGVVSRTAGNLTSAVTGTVIYNQGSNGQATVLATTYGNLTFSNFSKTLASSGSIVITGVFTPGTGIGHTITGSTIDFAGAGALSIPGFTYNNLTSSSGGTRTLDPVNTIRIAGVFTPGTSVYTITGSTVEYNGGAAQTLPPTFTTYNNLTLNNPTTVGGFAGLTVQGLLRVQAGTFTSSSNYNNVQIDAGATMVATAASTINVSGNWSNLGTFTPSTGTVVFNGNNNTQTLSGSTTFNNLTINHTGTGGVTASGSTLAVTSLLEVQGGTFTSSSTFNNVQIDSGATLAGTNATTMNVSGNWTNNGGSPGSFTANGNTVNFNGAGAQAIGGNTATTFNNLTIANAGGGVSLALNATVNGTLTLTNDLNTGVNTLIQPSTAPASAGTRDVIGNVQRTNSPSSLPLSTALTFGNPFNRITFDSGTPPTDVTINLVKSAPGDFLTAVTRTYTITPNGGGVFASTLQLHYLDPELNGNTEFILNLWRKDGATWNNQGAAVHDPTNNWVRQVNVTQFSPWTFANGTPTAASGLITGTIIDDAGAPVEGAVVRLSGTQNRKFITDANGFYRFDKVETNGFYTVTPSRANYSFSPAERSFSQIGEATEATFAATAASSGLVNPLDTPEYFVRQHYIDFLNREPDEAGFNFWSDQIIECGADQTCISRRKENVSAAYFLSIECQQTGVLVDGLYRASYGARPEFAQYLPDARIVGQGVQVNKEGWQALLEANKQAFVAAFVNRPAFVGVYGSMSNSQYVDTLISHTGVSFTSAERDALVSGLEAGSMTRAQALRSIAEDGRFVSAKFNDTFVMMEYMGYLRRDADAAGFAFWLNKLNQFNGNFEQAEMVKAFIVSGEYRNRFPR
jgi:hypothetical protein